MKDDPTHSRLNGNVIRGRKKKNYIFAWAEKKYYKTMLFYFLPLAFLSQVKSDKEEREHRHWNKMLRKKKMMLVFYMYIACWWLKEYFQEKMRRNGYGCSVVWCDDNDDHIMLQASFMFPGNVYFSLI